MKTFLKRLVGILLFVVLVSLFYVYGALPDAGPVPIITVSKSPAQIERGQYLANHVSLCIECHSVRNWAYFSGPIDPDTKGKGGEVFDRKFGLPGTFYARNITPYNLGRWTDGEIYHAITTGISRDGHPLFPIMPYLSFSKMDPQDVQAIIAYLRTLPSIPSEIPASSADFPVNIIMRTFPKLPKPVKRPDDLQILEKGKYLLTISNCSDCHTPHNQGKAKPGMFMAGGSEFQMPGGTVRSANLTPDPQTGIGGWSKELFVARFKQYDVPRDSMPPASPTGFNTPMPWNSYAGMKTADLEAIFAYLQTINPVSNKVITFTPSNSTTAAN